MFVNGVVTKEDEYVQNDVRHRIALGLAMREECSTRESLFLAINNNGATTAELILNLMYASGWREVSHDILMPMYLRTDDIVTGQ